MAMNNSGIYEPSAWDKYSILLGPIWSLDQVLNFAGGGVDPSVKRMESEANVAKKRAEASIAEANAAITWSQVPKDRGDTILWIAAAVAATVAVAYWLHRK